MKIIPFVNFNTKININITDGWIDEWMVVEIERERKKEGGKDWWNDRTLRFVLNLSSE